MRKAIVIGFDESLEVIDLDAPEGSLKVLQSAVDGWVQAIDLTAKETMWMNEEGKLDGLPPNSIATSIWREIFKGSPDYVAGNAVITGGVDDEGETIGLTEERIAKYYQLFN
jgi:hypothetical protein